MRNGYQPKSDGKKLLPPTGGSNIISPKNERIIKLSLDEHIVQEFQIEIKRAKEEARKQTAKEIISYLDTLKGCDGTPFKDYIWYKYLCKKYGVEVEE